MSYLTKRSGRIVAGTLAGALALSVTPIMGLTGVASAADALPPVADPIGAGNFCENGPTTEPFTDVADSDPSHDEIACLAGTGITTGVTATTYEPNSSITRRQMALFIKRLVDAANDLENVALTDLPAYDGVPDYLDVAAESTAVKEAVGQLSQAGIVGGFPDDTYRPADSVSRRQMAAFINRAQDFLAGDPFSTTNDYFNDDNGDSGEDNLNALASVGIFQGDGAGNVFPGADLTRRQMANILLRHAQVNFDAGAIDGPFAPSTNQSFTSDKTATVVLPDNENSPQVTEINFSGLTAGVEYDVYLVPCNTDDQGAQVFSDGAPFITQTGVSLTGGVISFNDDEGGTGGQPDDVADNFGTTNGSELEITLVGSSPTGGGASAEDYTAPANGILRVTVEGDGDNDCGIPVIVEDPSATDADTLALKNANEDTLENDDTPVRPFAVAPAVVSYDGVGENADEPDDEVEYVGAAAGFTGLGTGDDVGVVLHNHNDSLYGVDFDADNFYYSGSEFEGPITREQARAYLTIGDNFGTCDGESACNNIDTPYTQTGANNWLFDGTDELPASATGVVQTLGNFDGDGDTVSNDLRVAWTAPSFGTGMGGDVDEYCIDIWNVNNLDAGSIDSACTDEVDSAQTGEAPTSIVCTATDCDLEDLGPGTYAARVTYVDSETDNESGMSAWSAPVTIAGPPGPLSTSATSNDVDVSGTITTGDVLTVQFNSTMDNTPANDTVTVRDADGTTCTFADAGASTFVYSDTQPAVTGIDTLVITIGAPDSCTAAGTVGGRQYPSTVVATSGVQSSVMALWDLANSTDKTFD